MIKIEKLTNGCSAFLKNGKELIKGQLVNNSELEGIQVLNGTLTVSIDELEIRDIYSAKTPEILEVEKSKEELAKIREANIKELQSIVEQEIKDIDSAKTPEIIEKPQSEILKELDDILTETNKKIDSAKTPQKIDSAKTPQIPKK